MHPNVTHTSEFILVQGHLHFVVSKMVCATASQETLAYCKFLTSLTLKNMFENLLVNTVLIELSATMSV